MDEENNNTAVDPQQQKGEQEEIFQQSEIQKIIRTSRMELMENDVLPDLEDI